MSQVSIDGVNIWYDVHGDGEDRTDRCPTVGQRHPPGSNGRALVEQHHRRRTGTGGVEPHHVGVGRSGQGTDERETGQLDTGDPDAAAPRRPVRC